MLALVGSEIGRFWTIMSMLAPTSATTAKTRAATPGLFGTSVTVILSWERSCAIPEMTGFSMAFSSGDFRAASGTRPLSSGFAGESEIQVPFFSENEERTCRGTP